MIEAAQSLGSARFDPAEVERAVERAYEDLEVSITVVEQFGRFVADVIGRVVQFAFSTGWAGWLSTLIVVGAVVGLIFLALRRSSFVSSAHARIDDPMQQDVDWDALAKRAEAAGDLDGSVRAGYRALLVALANRGAVPDRRSLTASEARSAVDEGRPDLSPSVTDATRAFERIAYARDDARLEDVQAMRRALDRVSA